MIDIQTISIVMAGVSVTIAALYNIFTLRYTRMNLKTTLETRQAQLFMQIYDRFQEKEYLKTVYDVLEGWKWTDYDDFMENYGYPSNPDHWALLLSVGTYYEGIGVLVKRKLIDPTVVDDLMSGPIIYFWEKIAPIMLEYRKRTGWVEWFEWIEYLAKEIKTIRDQQRAAPAK